MAEGLKKVYLIGNLGADAEVTHFDSGTKVKFTLATTDRWRDKESGEKKEKTEWHYCVMWGPRAEKLAPHLKKGTTLFVEGRIETRSFEKAGQKRYATDIRALEVKFIGPSKRSAPDAAIDQLATSGAHAKVKRRLPPPLPA